MKRNYKDNVLPKDSLTGIYRGVVENNNDPLKAGRCKIRVVGLHTQNIKKDLIDSVPSENLIWAQPATPIFGGASQVGFFGVPLQGAHVFLFFENGNIMQPRYFATAPGIPRIPPNKKYGFSDPVESYPTEYGGKPDWNTGSTTTLYPSGFVLGDISGNKIEFEATPGKERIVIQHGKTKSKITFNPTGGIIQESGANTDEKYTGSEKRIVGGQSETNIVGDKIESCANAKVSVLGNKTDFIAGSLDKSVRGIENKKSGGVKWNIEGSTQLMTAGEASFVSDGDTLIKSNTNNVLIESTAVNIEMKALVGQIKNEALIVDIQATTTASFKGLVETNVGASSVPTTNVDGVRVNITGSALVKITGSIIEIG